MIEYKVRRNVQDTWVTLPEGYYLDENPAWDAVCALSLQERGHIPTIEKSSFYKVSSPVTGEEYKEVVFAPLAALNASSDEEVLDKLFIEEGVVTIIEGWGIEERGEWVVCSSEEKAKEVIIALFGHIEYLSAYQCDVCFNYSPTAEEREEEGLLTESRYCNDCYDPDTYYYTAHDQQLKFPERVEEKRSSTEE